MNPLDLLSAFSTVIYIIVGIFILSALGLFFIVKQQTAVVIERFGKFQSVRSPGFQLKIPVVDRIAGRLSLKVQQLDVVVETKTKDDVFVKLKVSVQYVVIANRFMMHFINSTILIHRLLLMCLMWFAQRFQSSVWMMFLKRKMT